MPKKKKKTRKKMAEKKAFERELKKKPDPYENNTPWG